MAVQGKHPFEGLKRLLPRQGASVRQRMTEKEKETAR
jgi:hypothetical protein